MTITKLPARRHRKPGDIGALRRTMWACLLEIEDVLVAGDADQKIKAAHCLAAMSNSYLKMLELADLAGRLDALEAALAAAERGHVHALRSA